MARSFSCPHCHGEIIVKHLRAGEQAVCRNCGNPAVVPSDAHEVDEPDDQHLRPDRPTPHKTGTPPPAESLPGSFRFGDTDLTVPADLLARCGGNLSKLRLYNPANFLWLGAFFSPLLPAVLAAVNWGRIGDRRMKFRALGAGVLFLAMILVVSDLVSKAPLGSGAFSGSSTVARGLGVGIGVAAGIYLRNQQRGFFQAATNLGARTASPLWLVLLLLVMIGGLITFVSWSEHQPDPELVAEAEKRIEEARFPEAQSILEGLLTRHPDESRLHFMMAWCCYSQQDFERAGDELVQFLRIEPKSAMGFHVLGVVRNLQGRTMDAERCFALADSLDPGIRERLMREE
jgi:tetratricopeptide (TPR) repeat protein